MMTPNIKIALYSIKYILAFHWDVWYDLTDYWSILLSKRVTVPDMIVFPYFFSLIYWVMGLQKKCVYVCASKHVLWAGPGCDDLLYRLKGLVLS